MLKTAGCSASVLWYPAQVTFAVKRRAVNLRLKRHRPRRQLLRGLADTTSADRNTMATNPLLPPISLMLFLTRRKEKLRSFPLWRRKYDIAKPVSSRYSLSRVSRFGRAGSSPSALSYDWCTLACISACSTKGSNMWLNQGTLTGQGSIHIPPSTKQCMPRKEAILVFS